MKTRAEIEHARSVVAANFYRDGISDEQRHLLFGMSVALCWTYGSDIGSPLQDLIDGREIVTEEAKP